MTTIDPRALAGACNNADLYEAMFTAQGLAYHRLPYVFVAQDTPPPYYSHLTLQLPVRDNGVLAQIKAVSQRFGGRIGLKDSFCQLDLTANGFRVLFEASWMWRDAGGPATLGDWQVVRDPDDLALWEAAWKDTGSSTKHLMFPPAVLEHSDFHILGHKRNGFFDAGCIANESSDCIGLSNVFGASGSGALFKEAASAASSRAPNLPLVGYESGQDLGHARVAGFETVGDLRILVAKAATF